MLMIHLADHPNLTHRLPSVIHRTMKEATLLRSLLLEIRNPRCLQQRKQQLFSARLALGIQESIWLLSKSILRKKWGAGREMRPWICPLSVLHMLYIIGPWQTPGTLSLKSFKYSLI